MKFKLGDTVRVSDLENECFFGEGDIGVVKVVNQYDYLVDFTIKHTGDYNWHGGRTEWFVAEEDMEAYNED